MKIKQQEEIVKKIARQHGLKARKVLEKKYGPDPYNKLREKGLKIRRRLKK